MSEKTAPVLIALCPTYKRPDLLANAVACFENQSYPLKRLLILDDAGQWPAPISSQQWVLKTTKERFPNLPKKYNAMVEMALSCFIRRVAWPGQQHVVFVVWEDDDMYLPEHLEQIAAAYKASAADDVFLRARQVYSTYAQPFGGVQLEDASGRFHSSWAFSASLLDKVGGWPDTDLLIFDQQFGQTLLNEAEETVYYDKHSPSYIYRWGNGHWHGSQQGDDGFQALWNDLASKPTQPVKDWRPHFDEETNAIFNELGC